MKEEASSRIESEQEVKAYLQNLKYALSNGAEIYFREYRLVDKEREEKYTNRYAMSVLFPGENPVEALKRELKTLTVEEYMRTVRDLRFPKRSEMREFGKIYHGTDEVYIKIRVELLGAYGKAATFVMSFHLAEKAFRAEMFPYRRGKA